jgi:enoyl-CoA hydratase/carnithine racemase
MAAESQLVTYEVRDRVALITLNNPDKLNPLSVEVRTELGSAVQAADSDDEVRCWVVTGSGRAFSAGGDMGSNQPRETMHDWLVHNETHLKSEQPIHERRKPIVGAINGLCLGAGFMLATRFDILLAAEGATFALPEVRNGTAAALHLLWLVGPQWTRYLNFTGDAITAAKAKEIGLVLEVFSDDQLLAGALKLAQRIASVPPLSLQMNRQAIDGCLEMMGSHHMETYARSMRVVGNALSQLAIDPQGRSLAQLRRDLPIRDFLKVRNEPFQEPWP